MLFYVFTPSYKENNNNNNNNSFHRVYRYYRPDLKSFDNVSIYLIKIMKMRMKQEETMNCKNTENILLNKIIDKRRSDTDFRILLKILV